MWTHGKTDIQTSWKQASFRWQHKNSMMLHSLWKVHGSEISRFSVGCGNPMDSPFNIDFTILCYSNSRQRINSFHVLFFMHIRIDSFPEKLRFYLPDYCKGIHNHQTYSICFIWIYTQHHYHTIHSFHLLSLVLLEHIDTAAWTRSLIKSNLSETQFIPQFYKHLLQKYTHMQISQWSCAISSGMMCFWSRSQCHGFSHLPQHWMGHHDLDP